jgi:hypothetical protein
MAAGLEVLAVEVALVEVLMLTMAAVGVMLVGAEMEYKLGMVVYRPAGDIMLFHILKGVVLPKMNLRLQRAR